MTTEEKANDYDEEIERTKELVSKENVEAAEYIFPELAESEDKSWIPKEIIKYLKEKGDYRSCWITWLEKQGEQKSDWSEEDEKMREKLMFLMEEENSRESWGGCYEWLQSLNKN